MRLTILLIKGCKEGEVPEKVSRQELLTYFQGNFLTLVHQMKDKILQLVHLMTEDTIPEKPSIENDVSVSDLLKKKQKPLQAIGIEEEIKQWGQEHPTSNIAVVLRKRTQHHHRVSGLGYDKDFLNLGFVDIATHPSFQENLSEYGKKHIEKMRTESTERLFLGALSKAEDTLKAIEENVETISNALVNYFKLPVSEEEIKKIMNEQVAVQNSLNVVNRTSIDKIPVFHKKMLDVFIAGVKEKYKDLVLAIYLIGSLGRGEYEEGYSDINMYVVVNENKELEEILRENSWFSLRVFTKAQFLSEQSKKYRIITKADGILLYGTDLAKEEKLPKAGLLLALTLNDDILEILNKAEKWMKDNPKATPLEISKKSRRLAKRILDFAYGVVMSNKPYYTASRKERIEKILEMYPNDHVIEILVNVSRYGVGTFDSFQVAIEGFRPNAEMNLKKMQDVKDHLENEQKDD